MKTTRSYQAVTAPVEYRHFIIGADGHYAPTTVRTEPVEIINIRWTPRYAAVSDFASARYYGFDGLALIDGARVPVTASSNNDTTAPTGLWKALAALDDEGWA